MGAFDNFRKIFTKNYDTFVYVGERSCTNYVLSETFLYKNFLKKIYDRLSRCTIYSNETERETFELHQIRNSWSMFVAKLYRDLFFYGYCRVDLNDRGELVAGADVQTGFALHSFTMDLEGVTDYDVLIKDLNEYSETKGIDINILKDNGTLAYIANASQETPPVRIQEMEKKLQEEYGAGKGKRKVKFFNAPVTSGLLDYPIDKLDLTGREEWILNKIGDYFNIPKELMPTYPRNQTGINFITSDQKLAASLVFIESTIQPFASYAMKQVNELISLKHMNYKTYYYADYTDMAEYASIKDSQAESNLSNESSIISLVQAGIITIQEARSLIGENRNLNDEIIVS